jgi:uncharacterized protein YodC (DUF2158 family)
MPLLGYAGYLPFGLECLAVAQFLFPGHDVERMTPKTKSSFQVKDHRHLTDGGPAMSAEEFAEEGRLFQGMSLFGQLVRHAPRCISSEKT